MKNGMRAIHPGDVIREDYLAALNMSAHALAQALHVPATHEIVNERRSITADTAMRLARLFSTTPELWMNLQAAYDLRKAEAEIGSKVRDEVRPLVAA